jgi:hypothetical protein
MADAAQGFTLPVEEKMILRLDSGPVVFSSSPVGLVYLLCGR